MDEAYGHPRKWPWWPREEAWGCLRRSWASHRVPGRERGSGARLWCSRVRGRALAETGGSGHAPQEVRERERQGGLHGGVLRTSRHLDWREGEARGGRGTWRQRSPALPRAPERVFGRHPRLFRSHSRVHLCLEAAGESKQWESGIVCSGTSQEWERDEKGRGKWLSREENWVSAPLNHCSLCSQACRR